MDLQGIRIESTGLLRPLVDTSVLVAGIAGFRTDKPATNPSAEFLRAWTEHDTFTWLISAAILDEYVEVLRRCGVHRSLVGKVVNLLREAAEMVVPRRSIEAQPDPDERHAGEQPFDGRGISEHMEMPLHTDDIQQPPERTLPVGHG